jgi:hypothetical protein
MLAVIEIALTVWAWKRGWRWWALLPLGAVFFIAFLVVAAASPEDVFAVMAIFDIAAVGVLIYMVARPRKKSQSFVIDDAACAVTPAVRRPLGASAAMGSIAQLSQATSIYPATRAKLILQDSTEIPLTEPVRTIGRSDFDKAVSLEDLKHISRQHLLIRAENGEYFAEDLNSANGTKINGIDIRDKGRQGLKDGDRIKVADRLALTFKKVDY